MESKIKTIMHLLPLQKVYVCKSGEELYDVSTQLLERAKVSWKHVDVIQGTLLSITVLSNFIIYNTALCYYLGNKLIN